MDINKVKEELNKFSGNESDEKRPTSDGKVFKPQDGEQIIRILPYKFDKDMPFIKLYWHYNLMGKHYVSPISFGEADPIVEFADKLMSSQSKEDFELGKKLKPKLRIYAPVLVRGKEHEGVKFWGFSKTIYTDILSYIEDPDYGDITDPKTGRDVTVEKIPPEKSDTNYAAYKIRVKPNQTPVTQDKEVVEHIRNMDNIRDVFFIPDYEKLNKVLASWMETKENKSEEQSTSSNNQDAQESSTPKKSESKEKEDKSDDLFGNEEKESEPSKKEDTSVNTDSEKVIDQFDKLFN